MNRSTARYLRLGILSAIVITGMALRAVLAQGPYNGDLQSFIDNAEYFRQRVPNFYVVQHTYGYPPLWYYVCGLLGEFQRATGIASFAFVERMFLSLVDLGIMIVLMKLAARRGGRPLVTGALFFLNPISIIITGRHGQFDNLTLFLVLAAILTLENGRMRKTARQLAAFALLTLSLLFKQAILFHVFTVFLSFDRKRYVGVLMTALAVVFFALSYVPFLPGALAPTADTMNRYGGILGVYGLSYMAAVSCGQCMITVMGFPFWVLVRNIFMAAVGGFIWLMRLPDPAKACLLMTLFFYTFTFGIAPQYMVYPLVFGALFPSPWFVMFSAVTGLFLTGHWDELGVAAFRTVNYNTVWITVAAWFLSELGKTDAGPMPAVRKLYGKAAALLGR